MADQAPCEWLSSALKSIELAKLTGSFKKAALWAAMQTSRGQWCAALSAPASPSKEAVMHAISQQDSFEDVNSSLDTCSDISTCNSEATEIADRIACIRPVIAAKVHYVV